MKKIRIWIRMSININQHTKYQNFPTNEFSQNRFFQKPTPVPHFSALYVTQGPKGLPKQVQNRP